jgi:hypothetical protein
MHDASRHAWRVRAIGALAISAVLAGCATTERGLTVIVSQSVDDLAAEASITVRIETASGCAREQIEHCTVTACGEPGETAGDVHVQIGPSRGMPIIVRPAEGLYPLVEIVQTAAAPELPVEVWAFGQELPEFEVRSLLPPRAVLAEAPASLASRQPLVVRASGEAWLVSIGAEGSSVRAECPAGASGEVSVPVAVLDRIAPPSGELRVDIEATRRSEAVVDGRTVVVDVRHGGRRLIGREP